MRGTVILGGANTYEGITDVRQGVVCVTHNTGLGSATTGHTEVQAGAALQVSGGVTVAEQLAIREGGVGLRRRHRPLHARVRCAASAGPTPGTGGIN